MSSSTQQPPDLVGNVADKLLDVDSAVARAAFAVRSAISV
jgi:hypothetical protein